MNKKKAKQAKRARQRARNASEWAIDNTTELPVDQFVEILKSIGAAFKPVSGDINVNGKDRMYAGVTYELPDEWQRDPDGGDARLQALVTKKLKEGNN